MPGPNWNLENDRKTVTVTFPTVPPIQLRLDVNEIENMLSHLGEFRALMNPPFPADFAMGQKVGAIPNPAWVTEPELMNGDSLIHIRDPRYGWLHYMIPREQSKKLAGLLQTQADIPPPAPERGRTN